MQSTELDREPDEIIVIGENAPESERMIIMIWRSSEQLDEHRAPPDTQTESELN